MNISIQKIISVLKRAKMNAARAIENQFDDCLCKNECYEVWNIRR